MKRFTSGDSEQFDWFRSQIQERLMIFKNVSLPVSCTPNRCRLGFEFTQSNGYKLYIDKNISFADNHAGFATLLSRGEASFSTYDDMMAFVKGLGCLFDTPQQQGDPLSLTYPVTSPHGRPMTFSFKYEKAGSILTGSIWRAFIVNSPGYGSRSTSANDTHRLTNSDGRLYVCWKPEPRRLDEITEVSKMWAKATAKYIDTGVFG